MCFRKMLMFVVIFFSININGNKVFSQNPLANVADYEICGIINSSFNKSIKSKYISVAKARGICGYKRINYYGMEVNELKLLSEQGDIKAKSYLANRYLYRSGTPKNIDKAINLLKEASEGGYKGASWALRKYYKYGSWVKANQKKYKYYDCLNKNQKRSKYIKSKDTGCDIIDNSFTTASKQTKNPSNRPLATVSDSTVCYNATTTSGGTKVWNDRNENFVGEANYRGLDCEVKNVKSTFTVTSTDEKPNSNTSINADKKVANYSDYVVCLRSKWREGYLPYQDEAKRRRLDCGVNDGNSVSASKSKDEYTKMERNYIANLSNKKICDYILDKYSNKIIKKSYQKVAKSRGLDCRANDNRDVIVSSLSNTSPITSGRYKNLYAKYGLLELLQLEEMAKKGDLFAKNSLVDKYLYGSGKPTNISLAIEMLTELSSEGFIVASYRLGKLYKYGETWVGGKNIDLSNNYYCLEHKQTLAQKFRWRSTFNKNALLGCNLGKLSESKLIIDYNPKQKTVFIASKQKPKSGISSPELEQEKQKRIALQKKADEEERKRKELERRLAALEKKQKEQQQAKPKIVVAKKPKSEFPLKPIPINFPSVSIKRDDIAVIIGNANYKKQGKDIPNVNPAYADAEGIKQYFMKAKGIKEGNIIYLKDATNAQLLSVFGNDKSYKGKLFNYIKPKKSNVYIYYAGHGAPGEEGDAYLVPTDTDSQTIQFTGYQLSTLYSNLGKLPAKSVTVILEACFSGGSQSGSLISKASPIIITPKKTMIPANVKVIAAGSERQMASWEEDSSHSLFTKYFLKAMSGEGDSNKDGKVSDAELKEYLSDTMTYYARRYYGRDQKVQIHNGG